MKAIFNIVIEPENKTSSVTVTKINRVDLIFLIKLHALNIYIIHLYDKYILATQ